MTNIIRRQLTLFVEQREAETIEKIRLEFNPRQFEIIKAHVTLCREDEILNLEKVITNLQILTQNDFDIEFGKLTRFDKGKGLLINSKTDNEEFDNLRRQILNGLIDNPRKQEPHITLMHPRNSTCTDNIFKQIEKLNLPTKLNFNKISLIEQKGIEQWKILKEYYLKSRN